MVLKVSITKEQADVLVKTATGLGMVTLRTMNVQDLIRFWIDQGCPLYGDPGFPAHPPEPAVGIPAHTPEQAAQAASLAAARAGKAPILRPGEKRT